MQFQGKSTIIRLATAGIAVGLLTVALPLPASANFFERLFGGARRAIEVPAEQLRTLVDPGVRPNNIEGPTQIPAETGPSRAFCVRTCDGFYFPVNSNSGLSTAESCRALCPAAETKMFAGGNIDTAAASDGSRYSAMPNAFAYRKKVVSGSCSCNGKSAFGLTQLDVYTDKTLRPGDIVATPDGLAAFTGTRNNLAAFTPVSSYRGLSAEAREKLSDVKILQTPSAGIDGSETNAPPAGIAPRTDNTGAQRNVQLRR